LAAGVDAAALVLAGGNALAAYDAGAFQARAETGLEPDHIAGSSAGAISAVLVDLDLLNNGPMQASLLEADRTQGRQTLRGAAWRLEYQPDAGKTMIRGFDFSGSAMQHHWRRAPRHERAALGVEP
jgi:predicted acylesterase/phospholipase RssA